MFAYVSVIVCSLALVFFPKNASAVADPNASLTITMQVFKVGYAGERAGLLRPAEQAKPGDILIYRASYRNQTKGILRGVVATVPVPPGLMYVPDSALPEPPRASKDGSNYFLTTAVPKNAPVSSWRALRWAPREIAPLSEFVVELRARVLGTSDQ